MNLKEIFAVKLRSAVQSCQLRGLYQSSQWAAEQLLGLEAETTNSTGQFESTTNTVPIFPHDTETVDPRELSVLMLSMPLMSQGQYQRCAYNVRKFGHAQGAVSKLGLFVYAYAQYLAGEKIKNELKNQEKGKLETLSKATESSKKKIDDRDPKPLLNDHLPDLYRELLPFYTNNKMDGYLLYIFAIISRDLFKFHGRKLSNLFQPAGSDFEDDTDPFIIFQQALAINPWNWSCWLEFEKLCIEKNCKVPTWDEILTHSAQPIDNIDKQCGRAVYAFFSSHLQLEQHRGDLALQAMEKLQRIFPTSLYLHAHIGVAYYSQRQYDRAEECFELIRERDPYRLQHMDTFSNILYVHEKSPELTHLAHSVVQVDKFSVEVCCIIGNHYSLKGQHERAVTYFQRALRLDSSYLSAWTLLGHEYMELRNTVAAVQCYRQGAELSGTDFRAWYGLGQTYEMLHLYQYAVYYYKKACFLRPADARMWSAVGNCLLKLEQRSEAILAFERAVQCGDKEGIATRDLARLYKEDNRMPQAAEIYYQYLRGSLYENETCSWFNENDNNGSAAYPMTLEEFFTALRIAINSHDQRFFWADGGGIGSSASSTTLIIQQPEQAEALIFLALYASAAMEAGAAHYFCSQLISYIGPEGDQARLLLRDLTQQQVGAQDLIPGRLSFGGSGLPLSPVRRRRSSMGSNATSALGTARRISRELPTSSRRQSMSLSFVPTEQELSGGGHDDMNLMSMDMTGMMDHDEAAVLFDDDQSILQGDSTRGSVSGRMSLDS